MLIFVVHHFEFIICSKPSVNAVDNNLYLGLVKTINIPPILIPSSTKRITKQILVIAKLNGRKDLVLKGCLYDMVFPSKQLSVQS